MDIHTPLIKTLVTVEKFSFDEEARHLGSSQSADAALPPAIDERKPARQGGSHDRELLRNQFPAENQLPVAK